MQKEILAKCHSRIFYKVDVKNKYNIARVTLKNIYMYVLYYYILICSYVKFTSDFLQLTIIASKKSLICALNIFQR